MDPGGAPGCVVPSMVVGAVSCGNCDVGAIVNGALPGMSKLIVVATPAAFAALIASRSEQ